MPGVQGRGWLRIFTRRHFNRSKGNAKRQTTKEQTVGVRLPSHPLVIERKPEELCVRYFGHSRSDSFDACAPAGETGGVLNMCFVLLGACQCRHTPCPRSRFSLVWEDVPEDETHEARETAMTTEGFCIRTQLEKSSKGENRNEIFPGSLLCADQNRPPINRRQR